MKIERLSVLLFVLIFMLPGIKTVDAQELTTIIFVRHAEKIDDSRDPELSEEGENRALRLAKMLENMPIDAIYSTDYKRTRGTIGPVAVAKQLDVQFYDPRDHARLDEILVANKGGTVLICGHSNSVPMTVNFYLDEERFEKFLETDYENFIVLTLKEKGDASVLHLKY